MLRSVNGLFDCGLLQSREVIKSGVQRAGMGELVALQILCRDKKDSAGPNEARLSRRARRRTRRRAGRRPSADFDHHDEPNPFRSELDCLHIRSLVGERLLALGDHLQDFAACRAIAGDGVLIGLVLQSLVDRHFARVATLDNHQCTIDHHVEGWVLSV